MISRYKSSIVVPSFCLILSACVEDDADSSLDEFGASSESATEADSEGDGDQGDGDQGDGDTGDGDTGDGDTGDGDTGQENCPPEGPFGTEVGDTIDDLVFYRGNGDPISLHDACGQIPPALIIFGTASW